MGIIHPMPSGLNIDAIRARFPALKRRLAGRPVAYFDGPGGTQVVDAAVEATTRYLIETNANSHWAYTTSAETDAMVDAARASFADFFGCSASEVVFGANMTTLTFHLARTLGREMDPGDEVVVTELDHHANVDPWRALAKDEGVVIRTVRMRPDDGTLDWEHFAEVVGPRTRLVAIGAASNALGTINDLERAVALARDVGARVFVDAVHYAAHARIDVDALGCDFLACSAYKFYGPHIGVLYVRDALVDALDVPKVAPATSVGPERFETGTPSFEGIAGAAAAVDFLASLGDGGDRRGAIVDAMGKLHRRGDALVERLWNGLRDIRGVRVYGPAPGQPRTSTVGFTVAGVPSSTVTRGLCDHDAIFTSHGDFYAQTAVIRLGLGEEGLVRAGCACYTTEDEVDRLVAGVERIAQSAP